MGQGGIAHEESKLVPGYRLDRYELLGPLAEGGMASVWIARQRGKHGFEKLVALKTILPRFAADERFQQMFLDEARIASRIEHFHVARILDLGEEHDVLYLAMEYVDGDSLAKLRRVCQKKHVAMPPGIVLRILADACAGLHEAHELKDPSGKPLEIVHRDISPHNILVSTKGVAKLIDFGIAKARDRMAGETNAGVLKGKVQYMAPEQALGRQIDRRADLWAIGATLYHCLAGRPPFEGENAIATLHLLTSGRPPLPLPGSVHPAIAAIVSRALSNSPEQRFDTAAEMREAMEEAMLDARTPATAAAVAAFANEHLRERAEKRQELISLAIAAAEERQRVQDMLKPVDRTTMSSVTSVGGGRGPDSAPPSGPLIGANGAASRNVFSSEPGGTLVLGPESIIEEEPAPPLPRRSPVPLLVGAVIVLGAVAVAVLAMSRPTPRGHGVAAPVLGASAATAATAPPRPTAPTASAAPLPSPAVGSLVIPVVPASALPEAPADERQPAAAPHAVPAYPPAHASPKPRKPGGIGTIDDGF